MDKSRDKSCPIFGSTVVGGAEAECELDIGTQCVHVFPGISGLFRGKHRRPNKEVIREAKNARKRRKSHFYACYGSSARWEDPLTTT